MFTYACLHFQDEVITQLQQNILKGCPYKKWGTVDVTVTLCGCTFSVAACLTITFKM